MRISIPGTNLRLTVTRHTRRFELRWSYSGEQPNGHAKEVQGRYVGDGLTVEGRNLAAISSQRFRRAYEAGIRTPHRIGGGGDLAIEWRVYTAIWAAEYGLRLPGDFVECGVNTGIISRAICEYVNFATVPKRFLLFDTFAGIPEAQASPDERTAVRSKNARIYGECYEEVREVFAGYPNVHLVRGVVPDSLNSVTIDRVAYLSIDMNLAFPELKALEYFWDRLTPGALVVLDDYGFAGHQLQHDAVNRFAEKRNVPVYTSPTGQGLIIRPPD